jgi:thiol-disulfide isomerase/thioredoxin
MPATLTPGHARWRYNRDVLALALLWMASGGLLVPAGRPAPYLEGQTLEGNTWGAELTGQVTIVEFFASWCPHCRRSLPGYRALVAERRVQLIIVDVEEEPALVREFFTDNPPPPGTGILVDPEGHIRRRWGVAGLPAAFLIDQTGTVRASFAGWGDDTVRRLARKIDDLNKPPPAAC